MCLLINHILHISKWRSWLRKKFTSTTSNCSTQVSFDKWCGKTCGKIKTAIKITVCRKSMFFQKKCLFSIPIPFRTLWWLCFVQSLVCPYFGILAENPLPWERGYITGATAPSPSKDACSQPHKATARCSGTNGWRPVRGLRPCDPIFI